MATSSPIPYYLDILSKWPSSIPVESQWFVYIPFDDISPVKKNIFQTIRKYETGSGEGGAAWDTSQNIVNVLTKKEFQDGLPHLACVFASGISIPNESIRASNQGLDYAGFQAPATMDYRNAQSTLSIKFIETNLSFIDFVIRPWTIMVGHYGFVTREDVSKNIRAPYIDVVYLGKTGAFFNNPAKRKVIRFHNAAPIKVQGMSSSYGSNGMQTSSVDFIYDYYSIEGTDSNSLADSNEGPSKPVAKSSPELTYGFSGESFQKVGKPEVTVGEFSVSGGGLTTTFRNVNGVQFPTKTTPTPVKPFTLNPLPGQNTGQGPVRRYLP